MTIKDIAKQAGVGVSTVSRVINQHRDVSKETKAKVLEVLNMNDFEPNSAARSLKQQSKSIVIIVKGLSNLFLNSIVESMQDEIIKKDYQYLLRYISEDDDEGDATKKICGQTNPLGIIFLGGGEKAFEIKNKLRSLNIPCVLATNVVENLNLKNVACVGIADVKAAYCAVEHLHSNGHKTIGIVGGNITMSYISNLRLEGVMNYYADNNLTFDNSFYQVAEYSAESAYIAVKNLIGQKKDITALFCMSDIMAVGAIRAIYDMNLCAGKDISVIGIDGIEIGNYLSPSLTTILQPAKEIAKKSSQVLIKMIENKSVDKINYLPFEIKIGESVATI